jgi:HEPN domain-containing protein
MTIELTETQRLLLSAAAERDDRCLIIQGTLKGGALQKVVAKLLDSFNESVNVSPMTIIKPSIDARKIFAHAFAFQRAYETLRDSLLPIAGKPLDPQNIGLLIHPTLVLSAFASELYLKTLICIETGDTPRGHNLEDLFMAWRVETRHDIDGLWDTDIRSPLKKVSLEQLRATEKGKDVRNDLRYALKIGARDFEAMRYFYEKEDSHFLLADFPYILRLAILKRHPDWDTVLPKPSINFDEVADHFGKRSD